MRIRWSYFTDDVLQVFAKLIHEADPQSQQVVIIVFAHVVRPSVPTSQNKTNFKRKQCIATGETVGLARWIIDVITVL